MFLSTSVNAPLLERTMGGLIQFFSPVIICSLDNFSWPSELIGWCSGALYFAILPCREKKFWNIVTDTAITALCRWGIELNMKIVRLELGII